MKALYVYVVRHAESANNFKQVDDRFLEEVAPSAKRPCLEENGKAPEEAAAPAPAAAPRRPASIRMPDPVLTARGHSQAAATGHLFRQLAGDPSTIPRLRPKRIFSSGFSRALQTCRPIAEALELMPELALDLHEEGGVFEGPRRNRQGDYTTRHGLNGEQMCELLPALRGSDAVESRGWWRGGVETAEEAAERAHRCTEWLWDLLDQQAPDEPGAVVCVSHGLFADRWLKALIGLPPAPGALVIMTANCGYWLIGLHLDPAAKLPRQAVLAACNVVDHVPMPIRTGHKIGAYAHCQPSYPTDEEDA